MTAGEVPARDHAILADLARVRLLSGAQLDRLHFSELSSPYVRSSIRRRTLGRLQQAGLVSTLPRRIGGERAGSAGLVYTLDAAGLRMVAGGTGRVRRPWAIGPLFVRHTLDVAELYVRLKERDRAGALRLVAFESEPGCWYRTARSVVKPDAYAVYVEGGREEHRWIEVDRSTESLSTLARKLSGYVEALYGGSPGPRGVFPIVVVTVISADRLLAVTRLIASLPDPAGRLVEVKLFAGVFSAGEARAPPPK